MTLSSARRKPALMVLAASILLLAACQPRQETAAASPPAPATTSIAPALVPAPAAMQTGTGHFVVDANTPLHAEGDVATRVARQFFDYLAAAKGPALSLAEGAGGKGGIRFSLDAASKAASPEAYTLDIGGDGIEVRAADERGLFYGAVTLWQLLTQGDGERVVLPALHIDDAPRFAWRGLMLDSARHFQSVEEIKRLLDAMALHKLNTFHWHLSDDQGWRIEIKRYPRLTEVGGCRIPAGDAGIGADGKPVPYCGWYTQAQIRDVVAYAAARHIAVVPEIDVPGHATAAIAAYPQLGVSGKPMPVSNEWGVHVNLFNAEESTFGFLENVFDEVVELFPGRYVHIGGDEAVKDQWQASPRVQQRMKELGAKDEMAMQSLLVARLEKFLVAHGKRLVGWDEILEGALPAEATVMSWRGTEGGLAAATQGHDVVMSPAPTLYFGYPQTDSPDEPPGQPGVVTLRQVYDFEPVPEALPEAMRAHVIGLQANVWTEHMRTFARVEHAVFPRIAALAETGWSPRERKDYPDFLARMPAQLRRYDALGIAYAKTPFQPRPGITGATRANTQLDACGDALQWRLEDDGPAGGARAVYQVNIFDPCWQWKQAKLDGVAGIEVRAGRIPYNFQLAHDEPQRRFVPARSAHGELLVRAGCDGDTLASVTLPAAPDADGFVTLKAALPARSGAADLCLRFSGDTRPAMWVPERVTLLPR